MIRHGFPFKEQLRSGLTPRISRHALRNAYTNEDYVANPANLDYAIKDWNRHEDLVAGHWSTIQPSVTLHVAAIPLESEHGNVFDSDAPDQLASLQELLDAAIANAPHRLAESIARLDQQRQLLKNATAALSQAVSPTVRLPI